MRDENEFSRRLRDFDAVWRRVNAAKTAAGLAAARRLPLTPRRQTQPCRRMRRCRL